MESTDEQTEGKTDRRIDRQTQGHCRLIAITLNPCQFGLVSFEIKMRREWE